MARRYLKDKKGFFHEMGELLATVMAWVLRLVVLPATTVAIFLFFTNNHSVQIEEVFSLLPISSISAVLGWLCIWEGERIRSFNSRRETILALRERNNKLENVIDAQAQAYDNILRLAYDNITTLDSIPGLGKKVEKLKDLLNGARPTSPRQRTVSVEEFETLSKEKDAIEKNLIETRRELMSRGHHNFEEAVECLREIVEICFSSKLAGEKTSSELSRQLRKIRFSAGLFILTGLPVSHKTFIKMDGTEGPLAPLADVINEMLKKEEDGSYVLK